jgi:hypothetical protein
MLRLGGSHSLDIFKITQLAGIHAINSSISYPSSQHDCLTFVHAHLECGEHQVHRDLIPSADDCSQHVTAADFLVPLVKKTVTFAYLNGCRFLDLTVQAEIMP